jgi:hypothetical protein
MGTSSEKRETTMKEQKTPGRGTTLCNELPYYLHLDLDVKFSLNMAR